MQTNRWLLLGTALTVSCGETTANRETGQAPGEFTFANNADNGNPRIFRFGSVAGFVLVDPATNNFSLHAGTNRQFGCNEPPVLFNFMDVQQILHNPDDPEAGMIQELRLGRNIYIAVYRGFDEWVASGFDCADLFTRKLAEGSGNFTSTDNDLLVFLRENNNANAFGFVAQGKLQRVGGGTAQYYGVSRCVWDGEDIATLKCVDKINFR